MKNCFHFNGYKPCGHSDQCEPVCLSFKPKKKPVLIIHLGALGAVVRSTGLIKQIKKKYPESPLFWFTEKRCLEILDGHPEIDRVFENNWENALILQELKFEALFCIDKSLFTGALGNRIDAKEKFGFGLDGENAVIDYYNRNSEDLYELGLSNFRKFHLNKKSEIALMAEAFDLVARPSGRPNGLALNEPQQNIESFDYNLPLTKDESVLVQDRKFEWTRHAGPIIGLNTGCSSVMPMKKLTVPFWKNLVRSLQQLGLNNIVLLGGHEDLARNNEIAEGMDVIRSEVSSGLRDGYLSIAACDLILTGDSLGMHLSIAAKKQVIAWFGPTCDHEIELFGRGIKLKSPMSCSPCWKRECNKEQMCYDSIPVQIWINAVHQLLKSSILVEFSGPETESPLN